MLFVCVALLVSVDVARGEATYQRTRNGKTLVWNNRPKSGDEATWSGARDREGYARGFGTLTWYTKQSRFAKPTLFARYFGNMMQGKFNGPVNVHSKKKTHYAIFDDGVRTTQWSIGTAPRGATARWRAIIARQRINSERSGVAEPEAPAEGPSSPPQESVQDLRSERWPKIDIDDSLRVLALPPRSLRTRRYEE